MKYLLASSVACQIWGTTQQLRDIVSPSDYTDEFFLQILVSSWWDRQQMMLLRQHHWSSFIIWPTALTTSSSASAATSSCIQPLAAYRDKIKCKALHVLLQPFDRSIQQPSYLEIP
jgi:hypothetical protein